MALVGSYAGGGVGVLSRGDAPVLRRIEIEGSPYSKWRRNRSGRQHSVIGLKRLSRKDLET